MPTPLFIKFDECTKSLGQGTFGRVYDWVSTGPGGPSFGAAVVKVALEGVKGAVVCLEREIKILSRHSSMLECLPEFFGDGGFATKL